MGYISKYDTKFITFVNRKYHTKFDFFDDYILWLFYKKCMCNRNMYYSMLEKDLWDYSDFQTGTPREKEKLNRNWKEMEKDKYGLYQDDSYVEYLKRVEQWKK